MGGSYLPLRTPWAVLFGRFGRGWGGEEEEGGGGGGRRYDVFFVLFGPFFFGKFKNKNLLLNVFVLFFSVFSFFWHQVFYCFSFCF